jgi:hypothetical protein
VIIVAHDADAATERIVTYLSSFDVPVDVAFFRYFTDDGRRYLVVPAWSARPLPGRARRRHRGAVERTGLVRLLRSRRHWRP